MTIGDRPVEAVSGPAGTPRKRITTERRERPFRWGIIAAVVGLAVTVVGGLLLNGAQTVEVLAASARAEVPNAMEFVADNGRYAIVLLPEPIAIPRIGNPDAELRCEVTAGDGSVTVVDGSRQGVSLDSSLGTSIGSFDSAGGPTAVVCSFANWPSTSGYFVSVAPQQQAAKTAALGLIAAGLLMIGASVVTIIVGVRGHAVITDAV